MGMTKDDVSRKFLLDVTMDGSVFVRERGKGPCPHGGLVFFSTDTADEAQSLIVRHCRRARDRSGTYRLNEFNGDLSGIDDAADLFRAEYDRLRAAATADSFLANHEKPRAVRG